MKFPKSPFYIIAQLILNYIYFIVQYIRTFNAPPPKKLTEIAYVETQYDKSCKKYANLYGKETNDENFNIDPVLYDFVKRKEVFASADNDFEKQWKSRILMENTPRGNVMMYFNPYLLSYHYYSDEQIIPYKILEQVATKYVVMYRCKDFFIDVEKRPGNKILEVLQKEEDSLKSKKMKVNDITKCVNIHSESRDVFAALKDYRSEATKPTDPKAKPTDPKPTEPVKKKVEEPKFSNKFVRIGKMCEFNITQKPVDKKIKAVNELMFGEKPVNKVVDFFDDLEIVEMPEEEEVKSSYKLFKSQLSKLKAT